jgi:hypothetical protein
MPKTKISEYSTTNSSNTDIESINIDEGCAPSGINNAIRELMVHLKEFQTGASGDPLTVAGTFVASGGATIAASAGTSASPSIHFSSDTNTGIFSPAADTIAFAEGGVERMRITSSGNVGIGTTTPVAILSSANTGPLTLDSNDGDHTGFGLFIQGPQATNTVNSAIGFGNSVGRKYAAIGAQTYTDGDQVGMNFYVQPTATGSSASLTEAMRIDYSGNVGIGTTSPSDLLDISASVPEFRLTSTSGPYSLVTSNTGGVLQLMADEGNTGANTSMRFRVDGAEAMRITSDGEVLVGGTTELGSVSGVLSVQRTDNTPSVLLYRNDTTVTAGNALGQVGFWGNDTTSNTPTQLAYIQGVASGTHAAGDNPTDLVFGTTPDGSATVAEKMRLTEAGTLLVGTTSTLISTVGQKFRNDNTTYLVADSDTPLFINRLTNDGNLVAFYQANTLEGTISVSGTTVSYNGGHLSRWAQMLSKPTLFKGTVMSNLDEMNVYIAPTTYWTEEDELPEDVNVGDVKTETHAVDNEQLNKVKVSDVEGDVNVAGVFVNWTYDEAHQVDEINMAMTGDMIIRIAQGVVVQKGDLLMSAGDGTAKPQDDDIVRSKTVAKVTSNHVTCTYEDGSYCVPCVLMAC